MPKKKKEPEPPKHDVPPADLVEAILFSAGKPMTIEEVIEGAALHRPLVKKALDTLVAKWKSIPGAVEIVPVGGKFTMQLRDPFNVAVAKVARVDLPRPVLKTLALVAYYQPMIQSELLRMLGPKVYDHVKELTDKGFILTKPHGRSRILATTRLFPEYFGIAGGTRGAIKKWIAERVGITIQERQLTEKEKKLLQEIETEESSEGAAEADGGPAGAGPAEGVPAAAAVEGKTEKEGKATIAHEPEPGGEDEDDELDEDGDDEEEEEEEE